MNLIDALNDELLDDEFRGKLSEGTEEFFTKMFSIIGSALSIYLLSKTAFNSDREKTREFVTNDLMIPARDLFKNLLANTLVGIDKKDLDVCNAIVDSKYEEYLKGLWETLETLANKFKNT